MIERNTQFLKLKILGEQCGETYCKPGSECCMGCDGPLGICEVKREDGGYGCPIPMCLPPGKIKLY